MDLLERDDVWRSFGRYSLNDDILIQTLLIGHNPDGREIDSEMLLRHVKNVMHHVLAPEVPELDRDSAVRNRLSGIEVLGSEEPLAHTIRRISLQMLCQKPGPKDAHERTMAIIDLLEYYRWDAKVSMVLAALGTNLGRFLLVKQLYSSNPLAAFATIPRRFSCVARNHGSLIKSLSSVVKAMIDVAESIICFESLPFPYVTPGRNTEAQLKSRVYVGAYWTVRSALTCAGQIMEPRVPKPKQLLPESKNKAMELSSLGYRLNITGIQLRRLIAECQQQIEEEVDNKLPALFKETHEDNQEVLHLLLAARDVLPLRDYSDMMHVSDLKDKVAILLISKPELVPLELLLFLFHQTYDHPLHRNFEGLYEIIWVPVSSSPAWTDEEQRVFHFFSGSVPWCSVRRPWLLSPGVLKFMRSEWNYKDGEAILVVLDPRGNMTNPNAMDMTLVWGPGAYPFSLSREDELWEAEDTWSLQLLLDSIDPIFVPWVEQDRDICIYGGHDSNWIQQLSREAIGLRTFGVRAEFLYVRNKQQITTNSGEELNYSASLSRTKSQFFWLRLESIRRLKLRRGETRDTDKVLRDVEALLKYDEERKNWAAIGKGSSSEIIMLSGERLLEYLGKVRQRKGEYALFDGISVCCQGKSLDGPCGHVDIVPFEEGVASRRVACSRCRRLTEKFVVYQ